MKHGIPRRTPTVDTLGLSLGGALSKEASAGATPAVAGVTLVKLVDGEVSRLLLRFNQVEVEGADGRTYAISRYTEGVGLEDLHEGQRVRLTVATSSPRVLSAAVVA